MHLAGGFAGTLLSTTSIRKSSTGHVAGMGDNLGTPRFLQGVDIGIKGWTRPPTTSAQEQA